MKDEDKDLDATGAPDEPEDTSAQIAIVGPSQSGKSIMLSALLNDESLTHDICSNTPNPFMQTLPFDIQPAKDAYITPPASESEKSLDYLEFVYYETAAARGVDSSDTTYDHRFVLSWQDHTAAEDTAAGKSGNPFAKAPKPDGRPPAERDYEDITFAMADGKGGDLTGSVNTADEDEVARSEEYIRRFNTAESLILCVSSKVDTEYDGIELNRLEKRVGQRLAQMARGEGVALQRVALCFTKAETRFIDLGNEAYAAICDPDEAISRMPASTYSNLIDYLEKFESRFGVDVRAFPVSTYGFVGGSGAANFYPHPIRPGLLTRTISKEDLNKDDGTGRTWRDHFPRAISDSDTSTLWQPFNVTPAFFFAATGRITGPMSFSVSDLQRQYTGG